MKKVYLFVLLLLFTGICSSLTTNFNDITYECSSDASSYARPNLGYLGTAIDPNFKNSFFSIMDENIGFNAYGSCTYIALELVLKYYDLYINDNIIDENYDITYNISCTTGYDNDYYSNISVSKVFTSQSEEDLFYTFWENFVNQNGYFDYEAYVDFVYENYQQYFHLNLLKLGYENGYSGGSFGLNYIQLNTIVTNYLSGRNLSFTTYSSSQSGQTVLEFTKSKIDQGIPVILGLTNNAGQAHSVVAYDYSGDTLYFNDGYGEYTCGTLEDIGYDYYNEAYAFEINATHTCNDDCNVLNENFDCICEIDGTHSSHSHSFTYSYLPNGDLHYASCICGLMTSSNNDHHTVNGNNSFLVGVKHYNYCLICNAYICLDDLDFYYVVY